MKITVKLVGGIGILVGAILILAYAITKSIQTKTFTFHALKIDSTDPTAESIQASSSPSTSETTSTTELLPTTPEETFTALKEGSLSAPQIGVPVPAVMLTAMPLTQEMFDYFANRGTPLVNEKGIPFMYGNMSGTIYIPLYNRRRADGTYYARFQVTAFTPLGYNYIGWLQGEEVQYFHYWPWAKPS